MFCRVRSASSCTRKRQLIKHKHTQKYLIPVDSVVVVSIALNSLLSTCVFCTDWHRSRRLPAPVNRLSAFSFPYGKLYQPYFTLLCTGVDGF